MDVFARGALRCFLTLLCWGAVTAQAQQNIFNLNSELPLNLEGVIFPTYFASEPLNAMVRQCGACHQTNNEVPPPFLTGDERQVSAMVYEMRWDLLRRIQSREMPPTYELQQAFRQSPDKDIIIKYLKESGN